MSNSNIFWIYTHNFTNTGAPLVLADIARELAENGMRTQLRLISWGGKHDQRHSKLHKELSEEGFSCEILELGQQFSENYTDMTTQINNTKNSCDVRINIIEQNMEEILQRSDTVEELGLKHARVTNETMNKEVNRLEKIVATLEDYQQKQLDEIKR